MRTWKEVHTLVAIAQKRRRPRQHECPPAVHAAAPTLRNHLRMGLSAWNTPLPAAFCNAAAFPVDTERERETYVQTAWCGSNARQHYGKDGTHLLKYKEQKRRDLFGTGIRNQRCSTLEQGSAEC